MVICTIAALGMLVALVGTALVPALAAVVSVSRDLPGQPVAPGEEFLITLNQSGFLFGAGIVIEELPEGFEYLSGTSSGSKRPTYNRTTNELTIPFAGEPSISYLVEAGTAEEIEAASFSGTWMTLSSTGEEDLSGGVSGDTTLTAAEPTPTPGSGNGGGSNGGGGGGGTYTPTPTGAPTPTGTISPGPTPSESPEPEPIPGATETPGVSPATPPPSAISSPTTRPLIPGFEALFAIGGLLAVSYVLRRR
jgi:hypothetical protein